MFGTKAIKAMLVIAASGAAISGAGVAQATTAQALAARDAHAVQAVHPRGTIPTPRSVQKAAPADVWNCYGPISILAHANQQWVSAEMWYGGSGYGMLRARAGGIGGWEQYTFCHDTTADYWVFYSTANNNYVTTEIGYTGGNYAMLRARASSIGPWEQYTVNCDPSGYRTIMANVNGQYVSAEVGYGGSDYGMLRARASAVGPWEQFSLPNLPCS